MLEHAYTYDVVGQRETRTERLGPLGPWTDEYSYDQAGQLTGVDYGAAHPYAGPGGGNLNLASYDFDEVGNRETETRNAVPTAYVADNVNRYTTVGGVAQTHSARGDLLHHNDFTLLYDADGHLISATRAAPATTQHYLYDPVGRRAGVASSTGGGALVLEYHLHFGIHVIDAHQPVSGLTEQYIFEPGIDQPLAAVSPGTGSIRFFHQDALGSVVALTDATGAPIELYRYTPWGEPVVYNGTGTLQPAGTQPQSRFMFTGREWNALTGLSHHRARQYSPSLGRWTGPDPIGEAGGLNLYAYVGNSATMTFDPLGLFGHGMNLPIIRAEREFGYRHGPPSLDTTQRVLDGGGMLPVVGIPADAANCMISLGRGDYSGALLSLAAMWPVGGQGANVTRLGRHAASAGGRTPLPTLKPSDFGPKLADELPQGVPRNWTPDQIQDAIVDCQTSIASRKAEEAAFHALGAGSETQRRAHAQRISREEDFLKSLQKALGR